MTSKSDEGPGCIILDACCVINLYASGRMAEILAAIPADFTVSEFVAREESLRYYTGPIGRVMDRIESIDLVSMIDSGVLEIASLREDPEKATFIELAGFLDDGEAMTGALALHRGWDIATDDRKAMRVYRDSTPGVRVITTPELMRIWVEQANPGKEIVADALRNVRMRARYEPGVNHPLYDWWLNCSIGE